MRTLGLFPGYRSKRLIFTGTAPISMLAQRRRPGLALAALTVFVLGFVSAGAHGQTGQWSWVSGSYNTNTAGVYGTLGTPAPGNSPGSRRYASNWIDHNGNLWLFGGDGYDADDNENALNDLWEFNASLQEWAWMGGDNVVPCPSGSDCPAYAGVYGTLKTASAANSPGGRYGATSWTDKNGNLWLFGGLCIDSTGNDGWCNDLWMYSTTTDEWTWMGGPSTVSLDNLSYGTLGVADPGNLPPGRMGAVGWTDTNGNLWLFGGHAYVVNGVGTTYTNDLWMFNVTTDEWTWMGGVAAYPCSGSGCDGSSSVYGTLGSPAPGNLPGARWFASGWTDSSGNFWLFGGEGMVAGGGNLLNDLWEYSPSTGEWTWMGGSDTLYNAGGQNGVYGTEGIAATGNVPGGRQYGSSWTDSGGNFWLMGGEGFGASGGEGYLNDLWVFCPATKEWTWVSGSSTVNPLGVFPPDETSSEVSASKILHKAQSAIEAATQDSNPAPTPGGRAYAPGWIDAAGNLWLFGGQGYSASSSGYLNDLWEFTPPVADNPAISLATGTYHSAQMVSIADATPNTVIYYTTDGSTPTADSTQYSGTIAVSNTETLKAIAYASGYKPSGVAAATYTIDPALIAPTVGVTPSSSSITTAQSLSVAVTVAGGSGNPTPTGSVTLTGGGYTSPAATLSGGAATINIAAGSLVAGSDTLTVTYTPDSSSSSTYNSATGSARVTVSQTIGSCTSPNPNPNPNPAALAEPGDFNGDCKSDILWRNSSTGEDDIWLMNGTALASGADLGDIATSWNIAGVGDFNGDGKADILWRNSVSGEDDIWLMNGTTIASGADLGDIATNWSIAGVGDFNGDGKSDILWRNSSTGEVDIWLMNGTSIASGASLGDISTSWVIAGVGDFNGDGKADILWRNSVTGEVDIWLMNGTAIASGADLGDIPLSWNIAGVGDFNGDGKSDILWRNSTTGEDDIWLMNGTAIASGADLGDIALNWNIVGVGDFNGDGKSDILWRNSTTGEVDMWLMNGFAIASGADLGDIATSWLIAGP
jgi:Chitobiase/beta-hexosaminidase C-terminal domain/FG-GAP-like repeat